MIKGAGRLSLAGGLVGIFLWAVACGGGDGNPSQPPGDGGDPDAAADAPGDPWGPEGQPACTSQYFCLEYPMATWENLHALIATPIGELWAAGDNGALLYSRSRGVKWARITLPGSTTLRAIARIGSRIFFAGDKGLIRRLEGTTFSVEKTDTSADLHDLWAAAENDVWAIGSVPPAIPGGAPTGVVLHFDGTQWSKFSERPQQLGAIHGSGAGDTWLAAREGEDIVLFRRVDRDWQEVPASRVRGANASVTALWVRSPQEIYIGTRGAGANGISRFDGSKWVGEYTSDSSPLRKDVHRLVLAPDGALWAATTPPRRREADGTWKVPTDITAFGVSSVGAKVEALAFPDRDPFVAGASGLLFGAKDPILQGMAQNLVDAKGFATGNLLQTVDGVLRHDAQGFRRVLQLEPRGEYLGQWVGGGALDDAVTVSQGIASGEALIHRYDGTKFTKVFQKKEFNTRFEPLTRAPNDDVLLARDTVGPTGPRRELGKVARGSADWVPIGCGFENIPARRAWTDGKDIVTDTHHVGPNGCEKVAFTVKDDIAGPSYSNLFTLNAYPDRSELGHFDGSQWKLLAKDPVRYCKMLYFGDHDIWLAPCEFSSIVAHWNGTTLEPRPVGVSTPEAGHWFLFGVDPAHLWVSDGHRIFRHRTN